MPSKIFYTRMFTPFHTKEQELNEEEEQDEEDESFPYSLFSSFVAQAIERTQMREMFFEDMEKEMAGKQRRGRMRCQRALKQEEEKVFTPGSKEDQYDVDKVIAFVEETKDKPEEIKAKTKQNASKKDKKKAKKIEAKETEKKEKKEDQEKVDIVLKVSQLEAENKAQEEKIMAMEDKELRLKAVLEDQLKIQDELVRKFSEKMKIDEANYKELERTNVALKEEKENLQSKLEHMEELLTREMKYSTEVTEKCKTAENKTKLTNNRKGKKVGHMEAILAKVQEHHPHLTKVESRRVVEEVRRRKGGSLTLLSYSTIMEEVGRVVGEEEERGRECPVCLEVLVEEVEVLPCLHSFHWGCLEGWGARGCPTCRR